MKKNAPKPNSRSTQKWEIDRRTFIKAGAATLTLPFLEAMLPSFVKAGGTANPTRYVCMYLASGTYIKSNDGAFWYPGATSAPLDRNNLPVVFQPFAANASDFSIIRGVENEERYNCQGTGGDHSTAVATYLSCLPYTDGGAATCTINGSSFDFEIAQKAGLKAIAMSAGGYDGYHPDLTPFDYGRTVSYVNGQQADCALNPYKLFYSLFAGISNAAQPPGQSISPSTLAIVRNKSILDHAISAINKLKTKVGTEDRRRLDDYFTSVRMLETSVNANPVSGAGCQIANPPDSSLNAEDHDGSGTDFPQRLKTFCDIIALAFKCNNAQVFSLMWEYENTNRKFSGTVPQELIYQGADMVNPGSHNEMAHWADNGADQYTERMNRCITRDRFYMSFVVYLMNALKAARDPSGSPILDNTIIQFGHGLHDGNHKVASIDSTTGLPMVLAGGRNLINPGQFHYLPSADLKDLYYTIGQKMGVGLSSFRGRSTLVNI